MFLRRATVLLLILVATVLPVRSQSRNSNRPIYAISGNVRDDENHQTMENVQVDLKVSGGMSINTAYTRSNGEFEFGSLSNGDYYIEVNVKGYEPYRELVSVSNSSRMGVAVFLRRPFGLSNTDSENTKSTGAVSVHELGVPQKAHEEYEKGLNLLYAKSDYRGAIAQFQRAIKDFPDFYEAYAQEGGAYMSLGELVSAEEAFMKSIELSSSQYPDALLMLSGMLNNAKRFAEAEAMARKGVTLDPTSWHGHLELARAHLGLKQLEDAEKDATEARDLKPTEPSVYLTLANIHIQRNDRPALLKDLDGFLKLVPTGPQAEQARKSRDELQAALNEAAAQPPIPAKSPSATDTKNQAHPASSDPTEASAKDQPPPADADRTNSNDDDPFFPPLPPPQP
jgi:Flp pilus assembly protein TadD